MPGRLLQKGAELLHLPVPDIAEQQILKLIGPVVSAALLGFRGQMLVAAGYLFAGGFAPFFVEFDQIFHAFQLRPNL